MPQNQNNQISFSFRNSLVRKPTGFYASGFWQFTCKNHDSCTFILTSHYLCWLCTVLCHLAPGLLEVSAACLCILNQLHWQHQSGDLAFHIPQNSFSCTDMYSIAPISLSATALKLFIEFTAFTTTASTTKSKSKQWVF